MALYHKHRPQVFADVIGQEHIIKTITNQIKNNRLTHAYLFSGPRGLGKTTTARLLAKAANCPERKANGFEPCDHCASCREISAAAAIDVVEIDAASQTGVDNVRENIIESARFRPTASPYKIFIIDEAHMLSPSAFNALLKILEEPPPYIIFILATTNLAKVPETVVSRCQRFNFKKVSAAALKAHLEKIAKEEKVKLDKTVIERIINKSDNCVRDAVGLLDMLLATGEKNIDADIAAVALPVSSADEIMEFLEALAQPAPAPALRQLNRLSETGVSLSQFAQDFLEVLRFLLINKAGGQTPSQSLDLSPTAEKRILKAGQTLTGARLVVLIDLILRRKAEIKSSPIPQLPLELAVVEWCAEQNEKANSKKQNDENNDNGQNSGENIIKAEKTEPKKEDKKNIKERVKELVHKEACFTLDDMRGKWDEFVEKTEKLSTSLAFIIKSAELSGVEGNCVQLTVGFPFHKDKLLEKNVAKKIEEILEEIMAEKVRLSVEVSKNAPQSKIVDSELQDLAAAFGGGIIN